MKKSILLYCLLFAGSNWAQNMNPIQIHSSNLTGNGGYAFAFSNAIAFGTDILQVTNSNSNAGLTSLDKESKKPLIYPNPAINSIHIENAQSVEITDLQGKIILTSRSKDIDVSSLKTGVYLAKVNQTSCIQFIKN